jgi:hypothetical protein
VGAPSSRRVHVQRRFVCVYDVPTILTVVLMLAFATLIATTVPILRIAGIDPAETLRDEEDNDAASRKWKMLCGIDNAAMTKKGHFLPS